MINQVIIAGRLIEDPRITTSPGQEPRSELHLELECAEKRMNQDAVGVERSVVQVQVNGERMAEVVRRYLGRDRHVLIHGRLRREGNSLLVVSERLEFMENKMISRPMWAPKSDIAPPQPQIVPAAAPAPPEVKTAPKVAAKPIKRPAPKVAAA